MGEQIIKQPNGDCFAIWSSVVDDFTHLSLTEDEIIRHYASRAYEQARAGAVKTIQMLLNGEKPYYQSTLPWEEANKRRLEVHRSTIEFVTEE